MTTGRKSRSNADARPVERRPATRVVVVGADGSTPATQAVRWASDYARATGCTLRIVTAWHWPPSYGGRTRYAGLDPAVEAREVAEKAAAETTVGPDRLEIDIREGAAGPALVAASESADAVLLAIGKPAGGIPSAAFSSSSLHCFFNAPCPVVIVR